MWMQNAEDKRNRVILFHVFIGRKCCNIVMDEGNEILTHQLAGIFLFVSFTL